MEIVFLGVGSNLVLEDTIIFDDFVFEPSRKNGITYQNGFKEIYSIAVVLKDDEVSKLNKDVDDLANIKQIARIAQLKLNLLFYKLSFFFKAYIFLNFPVRFKFRGETYKIENSPFANKLKNRSNQGEYEIKTILFKVIYLTTKRFLEVRKISKKNVHFCYLYHSVRNEMLDLNFRLLSAWKFIEEFIDLKCKIPVLSKEIPEVFFKKVINKRTISSYKFPFYDEQNQLNLEESKYNKKYLEDFYNEVRLVVAHHKREKNKYRNEKKYTPGLNLKKDYKMYLALLQVIPLLDSIRDFYLNDCPTYISSKNFIKSSSKSITFPKKLW